MNLWTKIEGEKMKDKNNLIIPKNYDNPLGILDTEYAIKLIKDYFQKRLSEKLNLYRVTSPLFVEKNTGINDDLNGIERPVSFNVPGADKMDVEVVQSLAKWKRMALAKYGFHYPQGIYTDMNAIRPDEDLDNLHSIYVDQWDWEKIISDQERNIEYLKKTVLLIYSALKDTEEFICTKYKGLDPILPEKIEIIHSEELLRMFPDLDPCEREKEICRRHKAVFIIGIGGELNDGRPHDGRAPDYDDWSTPNNIFDYRGLNGDILIYYNILDMAFEVSSMGIRVDRDALMYQLKEKDQLDRLELLYHKTLMNNELPLTIGGGIGQSRLCMLLLKKAHIGEIQAGIWSKDMIEICKKNNILLL